MILGIYKSPTFTRPVSIYESITTIILNVLDALSLKKFFEKRNPFQENLEHRSLVESVATENATIPYK